MDPATGGVRAVPARLHAAHRLPTALVVGTVLSAVNQGGVVVGGAATTGTWIRVAVNYLVPFLVASVGYLSARRVRGQAAPARGTSPIGVQQGRHTTEGPT